MIFEREEILTQINADFREKKFCPTTFVAGYEKEFFVGVSCSVTGASILLRKALTWLYPYLQLC